MTIQESTDNNKDKEKTNNKENKNEQLSWLRTDQNFFKRFQFPEFQHLILIEGF